MKRVILYNKSNNLLRFIKIYNVDTLDISKDETAKMIYNDYAGNDPGVNGYVDFMQYLNNNGLGIFISTTNRDNVESYTDEGFVYELNMIKGHNISDISQAVTTLRFSSNEFDDEEVEELLKVEDINNIYLKDERFNKLIQSVNITGSSWNVILNYLTEVYGYKFLFIFYLEYEKVSQDI